MPSDHSAVTKQSLRVVLLETDHRNRHRLLLGVSPELVCKPFESRILELLIVKGGPKDAVIVQLPHDIRAVYVNRLITALSHCASSSLRPAEYAIATFVWSSWTYNSIAALMAPT